MQENRRPPARSAPFAAEECPLLCRSCPQGRKVVSRKRDVVESLAAACQKPPHPALRHRFDEFQSTAGQGNKGDTHPFLRHGFNSGDRDPEKAFKGPGRALDAFDSDCNMVELNRKSLLGDRSETIPSPGIFPDVLQSRIPTRTIGGDWV